MFNLHSQIFWDEVNTGVSVQLNSVSNVSGQNAWACGVNGTVIKTTNSGYNWSSIGGNGIPNSLTLVNIYANDASTAFASGYSGTNTFTYRTTNGGSNWFQVFTQANGFINAVWGNLMVGDPVGGRWSLLKTSNGGLNWDSSGQYLPQAGSETGWNNSLWYYNNNYWFGTSNTRIYRSTNNGVTWIFSSTTPEVNSYTVTFDTVFTGFTGGTTLLRSTNSGQNWNALTMPGSGNITGSVNYRHLSPQNWSWISRGNSIYYSGNLGDNWSTQFTASAGTYTHLSRVKTNGPFTGPGYMYATKTNGGISRANLIIEGVSIISNEIPNTFRLFQNYPNPFNPSTKIVFSAAKLKGVNFSDVRGAFVSLKVYSTIGQEVAVLHDKIIQPGTYEADWDASNMPTGIYFYRLAIIDPNSNALVFSESRKMVLVK